MTLLRPVQGLIIEAFRATATRSSQGGKRAPVPFIGHRVELGPRSALCEYAGAYTLLGGEYEKI